MLYLTLTSIPCVSLLKLFHNFCRYTNGHRIRRHIMCNYSISTNDTALTYCHSWHDTCVFTYPNIIFYNNRAFSQ